MSAPEEPAVAAAGPSRRRRIIGFALRLAFSVTLLAFLIAKAPSFDDVIPQDHRGRALAWFAVACIAAFVSLVLQAWRWQRVLVVFADVVAFGRLVRHTVVGQFVGNALPTSIGGDVLRIARLGTDIGSWERAFASVTLERLTGWVALPLLIFVGFAADPSLLAEDHAWVALATAIVTLLLLFVVLFLAGHPRMAGRLVHRENWTRFLGTVHVGTDRMRRDPKHAASVLAAAIAYQLAVAASVFCATRVVDLDLSVSTILAIAPAVAIAQVMLPTLNGLGAREALLVFFLVPLGVDEATAITLGLVWYATVIVSSLPGAIDLVIARSRHDHTSST